MGAAREQNRCCTWMSPGCNSASLETAEIERYVSRDKPLDCAGGFRCEGLGIALFERIDSQDPTGLIGLPLIWVSAALRQLGFDLL